MAALSFLDKHPDDSIGAERPPLNFQQESGLRPTAILAHDRRADSFSALLCRSLILHECSVPKITRIQM
jgi:hypothetical protein